jgi:hypothetical protein
VDAAAYGQYQQAQAMLFLKCGAQAVLQAADAAACKVAEQDQADMQSNPVQ